MYRKCSIVFALVALCWVGRSGAETEEEAADYRQTHGAENTIWMNGLLEDYNAGRLSEADLMRELWAERPGIMTVLYGEYGTFTRCFQIDLISAETNGVTQVVNGSNVFFDASQFLDGNGNVIPGYERAYNNATRANKILSDAYIEFGGLNCQGGGGPPVNNKCCAGPVDHCAPKKTKR